MPRLRHDHYTRPGVPKPPQVGDRVTPEQYPAGFPVWIVASVPKAPGPSDVVILTTTDPKSPVDRISRRISQLRPAEQDKP